MRRARETDSDRRLTRRAAAVRQDRRLHPLVRASESRWGVNVMHDPVARFLPGTQVSARRIHSVIAEHDVSMQILVPTASGHGSKDKSSVFF